jgi:hypothetical protein
MSKPIEDLLQSIEDDFAASRQAHETLEARALFRLLNCCPPVTRESGAIPISEADRDACRETRD